MGTSMMGPRLGTTSNSMPMAGRGVRMSLNMMTPSGRNARQGCSDSSVAISAFSDRSRKGSLSEYLDADQSLSIATECGASARQCMVCGRWRSWKLLAGALALGSSCAFLHPLAVHRPIACYWRNGDWQIQYNTIIPIGMHLYPVNQWCLCQDACLRQWSQSHN